MSGSISEINLSENLERLSKLIEQKPWVLASSTGDQDISSKALEVTKEIFDLGISLEATSHSHLHPFLLSILEPPSIHTRSSTKNKTKNKKKQKKEEEDGEEEDVKPDVESFLPFTPLSELTIEGLDPEQIWAQLELRTEGIAKVVKEVGSGENDAMEGQDELQDLEDDDSEDDSEMDIDEFRQMLIESGETEAAEMDDEQLRDLMAQIDGSDEDEEDSDEEDDDDEEDDSDEVQDDEDSVDLDEEVDEEEDPSASDEDEEVDLDEETDDEDIDLEDDEEDADDQDDEAQDDEDQDEVEEEDDESALFGAGPSQPRKGKKAHPTLDDEFFSIDDFNRQTEELEAGRLTSGRLGGEEDDEEDLQDVGGMMLSGAGDDEDIMYSDFFERPRGLPKPQINGKGKAKAKDLKGETKGKGKKGVKFDEDDLMQDFDEEEEADEDDENAAYDTMGRMKGDLFDSDEEEEAEEKDLSNQEKRQLALAKQIAELESEAIGPKDWTLLGEATSKARPENSLLEENLDFEQVQKVIPVITDDTVKSLEEIIKTRILDNNFDSPIRVRAYEPTPYLPSRYFELQDTQSNKSLAQIYEEEYQAVSSGTKVKDPRDEKLKKAHDEIDSLWNEICYKLDALSSLNFVPKAPKAQITTISDLPTTSMETALPVNMTTSTMLAPQELFQAPSSAALVARSELTSEEAQKARQKNRKAKQAEQKKLGSMADLYSKKRKSVREEKDEALKGLVKSGKGVTVIGKGSKELGKSQKRAGPGSGAGEAAENREGGKRLKFRPRSVSRSSSSPSPPPESYSSPRASPLPLGGGAGGSTTSGGGGRSSRKSFTSSLRVKNRSSSKGGAGAPILIPVPRLDKGKAREIEEHVIDLELDTEHNNLTELDQGGFSTQYGASASSPSWISAESSHEFLDDIGGEQTEVEDERLKDRRKAAERLEMDRMANSSPIPPLNRSVPGRRGSKEPHNHPIPPTYTLFPISPGLRIPWSFALPNEKRRTIGIRINVTRRRCEDAILLSAVILGVWKLGHEWGEKALAGEISLLVGLSILYTFLRFRPIRQKLPSPQPSVNGRPHSPQFAPSSPAPGSVRERVGRNPVVHPGSNPPAFLAGRDDRRPFTTDEDGQIGIGGRGCLWGTEPREYRESLDDGIFFAIFLGPLVASALLHAALSQLSSNPETPLPGDWNIELPLVLPSTPVRQLTNPAHNSGKAQTALSISGDTIKALSALATSRRNLVQLFTLCGFVLLVHLVRSLHLEVKQSNQSLDNSENHSRFAIQQQQQQQQQAQSSPSGTYWLRLGEWKRTKSVVGFSFLVTGCCVIVKIVTAIVGRGVWSDMSPSDIVIATLFYQFSLYVCIRLARRGFTLGELAVVCNAATALFMEVVNLTRMKIVLLQTPYIKTYRLPTPLLTFQLALIPGSLLAGFLLSPLLYLSRHLAQKPAHRLRFPHEKPVHRRLLALGFYGGSALVCGGLVGLWTQWLLGGRNPFVWVVCWFFEGKYPWTRPALISYWGGLAAISVAGWNRQLSRARKHRRYTVPGTGSTTNKNDANTLSSSSSSSNHTSHSTGGMGIGVSASGNGERDTISGVASSMMDAADQRMPTLSVNARRKFFHALAVVMFIPGIAVDPAFTHLSFSVAFAAFNFAEYIRYFALWPFGVSVHLFLNEFLDHKDSGTAILSHFYLLAGCASPLWLEGPSEILCYFGVLSLGIGDALASIVGRKIGTIRWTSSSGKTVEGSIAFLLSMLLSSGLLWVFGLVDTFKPIPYIATTTLATLLEAFSDQNDNLILPMYGWALGTLLGG
uniref:dolichol kinase n=1 Tax=Kwoniella dejecticola CBS 10117 TaxID=1296121 RepID=A0A1A6A6J1_9TREE|nr:dolichol kinase [Kwoniella dejecticola CBS 10117]OBR85676.1 dolichol kinase [Kwoniella dejecticola CBS 10117]